MTYIVLRFTQRKALKQSIADGVPFKPLTLPGKCVAGGIGLTAVALLAASAFDRQLGLPTFLAGAAVTIVVLHISGKPLGLVLRDVSWGVLPLVAGLFILVESVERTGVLRLVATMLHEASSKSVNETSIISGTIVAIATNILNNLPVGLATAIVNQSTELPAHVTRGLLIGVDLGPNLSVTGSLATILWLIALRREGEDVSSWQFLKLGCFIMPPALVATLVAMIAMP